MKTRMPTDVAATVFARSGGNCEAMISGVNCTMQAEHLHHRQLRSQGGEHTVSNLVYICHRCHDWIHKHPSKAAQLGFIVQRDRDPETVTVLRRGRKVTLLENGTVDKQSFEKTMRGQPLANHIDWGETSKWQ